MCVNSEVYFGLKSVFTLLANTASGEQLTLAGMGGLYVQKNFTIRLILFSCNYMSWYNLDNSKHVSALEFHYFFDDVS